MSVQLARRIWGTSGAVRFVARSLSDQRVSTDPGKGLARHPEPSRQADAKILSKTPVQGEGVTASL